MRMCRRLGNEGKRVIELPALDVNTYKYDYPNTLDARGTGVVGYYYSAGQGSRRYCRIDFHVPRRIKHLDCVFVWPSHSGNYVQSAFVDIFRGDYPHNRPPYGSYAREHVLLERNIYGQIADMRADLAFDITLEAGDYCIYFWSEETHLSMNTGLTTDTCTIKGYTGSRPE